MTCLVDTDDPIERSRRRTTIAPVAFTSGYSKLDPTRGNEGRHANEYRLLLNVPVDEIRIVVDSVV